MASAEKSPPSIRVAEVITAVLSVSSLSRIWPQTWSGATCSRAGDPLARLAEPQHVGLGVGGHPLGGDEDLLHQALGLGQAGVGLAGVGLLRVRRDARARGVAHQRERLGQLLGQVVEATRRGRGDGVLQRVGGLGQPVGLLVDVPLRAAGGPLDVGDGQLVGGRLGDPRDDLVRLVDDHRVVVGDHRDALDRVDGEQRVVGDDQVRPVGLLLGPLGEALLGERALRRAQALAVVDADLPPRRGRCAAARCRARRSRRPRPPARPRRGA